MLKTAQSSSWRHLHPYDVGLHTRTPRTSKTRYHHYCPPQLFPRIRTRISRRMNSESSFHTQLETIAMASRSACKRDNVRTTNPTKPSHTHGEQTMTPRAFSCTMSGLPGQSCMVNMLGPGCCDMSKFVVMLTRPCTFDQMS
jgi:hypothetical protein